MRFSDPDDKSSFIPVNYGVTNADLQFSPYITAQHHGSAKHSPSLPSLQYVFPPTKYIIIHSQRISPHLHPPHLQTLLHIDPTPIRIYPPTLTSIYTPN